MLSNWLLLILLIIIIMEIRYRSMKKKFLEEMLIREEAQKNRIAKDLHDESGQMLTALTLNLRDLKHFTGNDKDFIQRIDNLIEITSDTINEIERLINNLRPGPLEGLGLVPALKWFINEYIKPTGIKVSCDIDYKENISKDKEALLYRIIQESLTNILRHASASEINITLKNTHKSLLLSVKDNGKGFQVEKEVEGNYKLGLRGIRERTEFLGGNLKIQAEPEKGTTIHVNIPIN